MEYAVDEQKLPRGRGIAIVDRVASDILLRSESGKGRYGERLRPFNGRDALMDAYQEAIDLVMYLRQAIEERDYGGAK